MMLYVLNLHYDNSNSKLTGFPAPGRVKFRYERDRLRGRGMNTFRCVIGQAVDVATLCYTSLCL
jgi:hypothetical protein